MKDYELKGVVFYNTAYPNLTVDISEVISLKQEVLRSYTAQFTSDDLENLISQTTLLAAFVAQEETFAYGESLKVVALHHGCCMDCQLPCTFDGKRILITKIYLITKFNLKIFISEVLCLNELL